MPPDTLRPSPADRSRPQPVKHWSFAGLMLTYWCNARCASCYMNCSPRESIRGQMSVDAALAIWRGLVEASPHGCRIHLSGGEPFGDWERLIQLCRRAHDEGFLGALGKQGPLASIETNAFWAVDEQVVRERITDLNQAGMGKLVISADPYHQQFVPIQRCILAARVATEILGLDRVQVRWRDCLEEGRPGTGARTREESFAQYAKKGRERLNGRAADMLAKYLPLKDLADLADSLPNRSCSVALLRSRHVHIDPGGLVMPGTCSGIILGRVCGNEAATTGAPGQNTQQTIPNIWRQLYDDFCQESANDIGDADRALRRPIVSRLALAGPFGLLDEAHRLGFRPPAAGYASKCHLCWELRRFFVRLGLHSDELGPRWLYDESPHI